jgi:ribosomal protein S18 acetylase RimI-like enzyme
MRIRFELCASDREPIERIVRDVGVFRPEEIEIAMELVSAGLAENEDEYLFAVAEGNAGEVLGYACWGHAPMTEATYDLYWIAVDPALHGQGVGRVLLLACEEDVRRRGATLLLIETESVPAYEATRRFYLRAGYSELARIPNYYRNAADKIIYGRSFG